MDHPQGTATRAGTTAATLRRPAEGARAVDAVAGTIRSRPAQTDRLALDATIAAARGTEPSRFRIPALS